MKCTPYELLTRDEFIDRYGKTPTPCKCPRCGGFLSWQKDLKTREEKPVCNKCHGELILLPDFDEETGEELDWGRICDITVQQVLE